MLDRDAAAEATGVSELVGDATSSRSAGMGPARVAETCTNVVRVVR
jgi:hypothetical protein